MVLVFRPKNRGDVLAETVATLPSGAPKLLKLFQLVLRATLNGAPSMGTNVSFAFVKRFSNRPVWGSTTCSFRLFRDMCG